MTRPLISIIVPVYNAEKYIKKCVDSLINQTYENLEIILINDGSKDNSYDILSQYEGRDPRIVLINKDNTGVSDTRNIGIDKATGEYIGFVDADDYVEPQMYEKLFDAIVSEGADISCAGYLIEDEDNAENIIPKAISEKTVYSGKSEIFERYLRQDYYTGIENGNWNKLFKSSVIKGVRYSKYAYGEDVEFLINTLKNSDKIVCIEDTLYHHITNSDGASQKKFNMRMMELVKVSDDVVQYINENYPDNIYEAEAFRLTWYMVIIQILYSSDSYKNNREVIRDIRNRIKEEYALLKDNKYTKRLDRYYMKALMMNCVYVAMIFRKLVVAVKR